MALDLIWVVPHPRAENRVALAEDNPEHPINEYGVHQVYVAKGTGPVRVAVTPEVNRLLAPDRGLLVRVDGDALEAARDEHATEQEAKRTRRQVALLEKREAEEEQIGSTNRRANQLELQLVEMQARLDQQLIQQTEQVIAERAQEHADRALAAARTAADQIIADAQAAAERMRSDAEAANKPAPAPAHPLGDALDAASTPAGTATATDTATKPAEDQPPPADAKPPRR